MATPTEPRARLFVAVFPDAAAIRGVEGAVRRLPAIPGLRFLDSEELHVTLRFLGSVPMRMRAPITEACVDVAAHCAPFELTLSGGGAFPSPRRASVLWIGATEGATALSALVARLNSNLDRLDFERDARRFTPHLTIARSPRPLPLMAAVEVLASVRVSMPVRELLLVQSHLDRRSARYEVLERCAL